MHRERLVAGLGRLRVAPPRSDLPRPRPLGAPRRPGAGAGRGAGRWRGRIGRRLASAFPLERPRPRPRPPPRLDLWVTPPAYTGRAAARSEQPRPERARGAGRQRGAGAAASSARRPGRRQLVWARPALPFDGWAAAAPRQGSSCDRGRWLAVARSRSRSSRAGSSTWHPTAAHGGFAGQPQATHRGVLRLD